MTRIATLALALTVLMIPALAPADDLPANQWTKIGMNDAGVRVGSAVIWLDDEQKFLVIGGLKVDKWTQESKIPSAAGVMTFDPKTQKWEAVTPGDADAKDFEGRGMMQKNKEGKYRLNSGAGIAGSSVWDAEKRQLYVYSSSAGEKEFSVYRYDAAARTWERFSTAKPPADANGLVSGEFGWGVIFMEGASAELDPVNRELLFVGGRTGNAADGFVGHWALSLDTKEWRKLEAASTVLDPLRTQVAEAHRATRDAMAAARNVFYTGLEGGALATAVKDKPAQLAGKANGLVARAAAAIASAKADGWQADAVAQAKAHLDRASANIGAAGKALAEGQLSPELLKQLFDAAWSLDVAIDCLRTLPGPREGAGIGYDRTSKSIIVFGGDHGDYLLNDTWVYDCGKKSWRQLFPAKSPEARRAGGNVLWLPALKKLAVAGGNTYVPKWYFHTRPWGNLADVWTFDIASGTWDLVNSGKGKGAQSPALSTGIAAGNLNGDVVLGMAHTGQWRGQTAPYYLMRIARADGDDADVAVAPQTRLYLSVVNDYDPTWFDAAPPGDRATVDKFLAALKPNTWTTVPISPRPAAQRSWGTSVFDPVRDQWYHWTGGHQADPANEVSTYHPAINRWSIPYVAEYYGKAISFNGRPDSNNHTYLTYTYDELTKKMVATTLAGTSVYDPDRCEWEPVVTPNPYKMHLYVSALKGTPHGVVAWHPGYFGIFDVEKRAYRQLPVKSVGGAKMPWPATDGTSWTYDSKRDVLWLSPFTGYQKPAGQLWKYDFKTSELTQMNPAGQKEIGQGPAFRQSTRETVYLPDSDLVLYNNFLGNRQVAYDPAGNRWVVTDIAKTHGDLGNVDIGLMWDAKRKLVWAQSGSRRMFVMRPDAEKLEVATEAAEPAADKKGD